MDKDALGKYTNWIGKSPAEILNAVKDKKVGGWAALFPSGLPLWAHRVRNFFNQEPKSLMLYDSQHGNEFVALIHTHFKTWKQEPGIAEFQALSGDVYKDEYNKTWFQMSPGGAIYHFGRDPRLPKVEAVWQTLKAQIDTPTFKLVSPDGSGGSTETIISNPRNQLGVVMGFWTTVRRSRIGEVNKRENVSYRTIRDIGHQGSYNYAETVEVGLSTHQKYDVTPHEKYNYSGVYVNPPDRFTPLTGRMFPTSDGNILLATQVQI